MQTERVGMQCCPPTIYTSCLNYTMFSGIQPPSLPIPVSCFNCVYSFSRHAVVYSQQLISPIVVTVPTNLCIAFGSNLFQANFCQFVDIQEQVQFGLCSSSINVTIFAEKKAVIYLHNAYSNSILLGWSNGSFSKDLITNIYCLRLT